jgi:multicomponent Na+:H+ antiporter subunit G
MSVLLDIASWILLLAGSFFALTAALGIIRLPDFFSRTHAIGVLDTGGAALILLGFGLQTGFSLDSVKLALVLIFLLLTGPTAAHALARSALHTGVRPRTGDAGDE